jgi:hypothetical protein
MARPRCIPVHPARLRNDRHRQVSWLPDRCSRAAFPGPPSTEVTSGVWRGRSPVTVAGAAEAQGTNPIPPSLFGPAKSLGPAEQPMTSRAR